MKYSALQINLKFPGAGGFYNIHIWGKPDAAKLELPVNPVEKQRDELILFYKEQNIHLKTLTQTHGKTVLENYRYHNNNEPEADAFFTTNKSFAMAVKTADCIPILFFNKQLLKFGAIHSGWRGLHNRILSETLVKLRNSQPDQYENYYFVIGPHIQTMDYETSEEVFKKFKPSFAIKGPLTSKRYLNMEGILRDQFNELQISEDKLTWINANTFNSDRFFSHRSRDTGRNFNVIFYSEK